MIVYFGVPLSIDHSIPNYWTYCSRIYTHTSILDIRKDMLLLLHSILISSIEDIVTIAIDGITVFVSGLGRIFYVIVADVSIAIIII